MSEVVPFRDLRHEWAEVGPEMRSAAERVLASGRYVLEEEVDAFERTFAIRVKNASRRFLANPTEASLAQLEQLHFTVPWAMSISASKQTAPQWQPPE